MAKRLSRCRNSGFALLELLIALGLAGLVTLLMLQGVGLAARSLDRLTEQTELLEERGGLEMLMRRTLAGTIRIPLFEGERTFDGQPTSVSLLSVVEDGTPGLYRIQLAFDAPAGTGRVTFSKRPAGKSALPGSAYQSVLVRHVRNFGIEYLGAASPGADPVWHHRWQRIAYLPLAVRITLDSAASREQPAVIVRLPRGG